MKPCKSFYILLFTLWIWSVSLAQTVLAEPPPMPASRSDYLEVIQKRLSLKEEEKENLESRSESLALEMANLQKKVVRVGEQIQKNEINLLKIEKNIASLEDEKNILMQSLEENKRDIGRLVMALQRIKRLPPEAMIAKPDTPIKNAQSAMLLQTIVPKIYEKADALNQDLKRLDEIQTSLERDRDNLKARDKELSESRESLERLLTQRQNRFRATQKDLEAQEQVIARVASKAKSMQDLISRLFRAREKTEKIAKAAAVSRPVIPPSDVGSPRLPVAGRVTLRFQDKDIYGAESQGIEIEGRGGALVVAPMSGIVRFAGEFKNYRQLIIIEHANKYFSLIGGLERIDINVGQSVNAGEPIGTLHFASNQNNPTLYYELRHNGAAINPSKKFAGL